MQRSGPNQSNARSTAPTRARARRPVGLGDETRDLAATFGQAASAARPVAHAPSILSRSGGFATWSTTKRRPGLPSHRLDRRRQLAHAHEQVVDRARLADRGRPCCTSARSSQSGSGSSCTGCRIPTSSPPRPSSSAGDARRPSGRPSRRRPSTNGAAAAISSSARVSSSDGAPARRPSRRPRVREQRLEILRSERLADRRNLVRQERVIRSSQVPEVLMRVDDQRSSRSTAHRRPARGAPGATPRCCAMCSSVAARARSASPATTAS